MEILTVAVQKGGTGKTTTAAALLQAAKTKGLKVLAIDLDPQSNLTYTLAGDLKHAGSYELLSGTPAADVIQTTRLGIDLIAGSTNLQLIRENTRLLEEAITPIKENYDLIVIDTPPTAGILQYNALQAAKGLIIPMQADIYNLQSLYQIVDTAKQFMKSNKELSIKGIVFTMNSDRSTLARQMQDKIINAASGLGVNYIGDIRKGVAIKEAAAMQLSLYDYAPTSNPAIDYMSILQRICVID